MANRFILGTHKHLLAPMVEHSELAYRLLVRKYGCELCYSPMINVKSVFLKEELLEDHFSTCPEDRPLVVQLAGCDPTYMLRVAQLVEKQCDAVDINLGCPQGIARKGNYGAYLLDRWDIIQSLVETLSKNLSIPVLCKIRLISDNVEKTIDLAKNLEKWGCKMLTVHGRTKEMNKQLVEDCDWIMIKRIKESLTIPVVANGGIECFDDVRRCLEFTGCDGVMSGEAILENPAFFSPTTKKTMDELALEYIDLAYKYKSKSSEIRGHLFKMLQTGLCNHPDLRDQLGAFKFNKDDSETKIKELIIELGSRMNSDKSKPWSCLNITLHPDSFYMRHRRAKRKKASLDSEKLDTDGKLDTNEKLNTDEKLDADEK